MSKFLSRYNKWRKSFRLSIIDPKNFEEVWGVNGSRIQFVSLGAFVGLVLGILFALLIYFLGFLNPKSDAGSVKRSKIEEQHMQIQELKQKLDAQEQYISNIRDIILGRDHQDTLKPLNEIPGINPDSINYSKTEEEKLIESKVKDDIRTQTKDKIDPSLHFISPVVGVISQTFNQSHKAIDIVTKEGSSVKACLSGTLVYSAYSQLDGHVIIIDHGNGFISVYKHNKTRLKKMGDKVRTGDPIALVGNSGENSTGPHLHFELWLKQQPVNPTDYFDIRK